MADARFRDLCLDASEPAVVATFWATVLERELIDTDDGGFQVGPLAESESSRIWVDPVPEPRTAKTRVHLDVHLPRADPAELVAAGATVVREPHRDTPWWVLADPDGNEFCAFPPNPDVQARGPFELVVDSVDPWAQATWWADRTGGRAHRRDGTPFAWIEGAEGFPYAYWVFTPVPETKSVKNRMHWDVQLTTEGPDAFVAAGARVQCEPDDEIEWWVLTDPEGNEFCAFAPGAD